MVLGLGEPSSAELSAFQGLASALSQGVRWLFERDLDHPGKVNARVLAEILSTHGTCEYGLRHGFSSIRNVDQYIERVPLLTYAEIESDIERMACGEPNVLSSLPIDYFMLTSGTSRAPKLIPTNRRERKRRIPFYAFLPQGTLARAFGPSVIPGRGMNGMSIASSNRRTPGGTPVSSSLRIGLAEHSWLLRLLFSSPVSAYRIADVEQAYYAHWLFALRNQRLRYVSDEFASKMTYALTVLVRNHERLATDIELGRLDPDLTIDPEIRRDLEGRLSPDAARAAAIRHVFAEAPDGEGILPRLWPQLKYVACIYTGTFGVYEERLRKYTGGLPVFNTAYGLSEACVATALAPNDTRYTLYPRAAFFEFIREEDIALKAPRTHTLDELEVGESYEIVVTNFAGLYRYRTADVIRVLGFERRAPIVEFRYRANVLMNINAEMMTEVAAFEALKAACAKAHAPLVEYTIRADTEAFPPRYVFYVELARELDETGYHTLEHLLDAELCRVNPRYEDRIHHGRLQRAALVLVRKGAFEALSLQIAFDGRARGISAVQTKVPRLLEHEPYRALLELHGADGPPNLTSHRTYETVLSTSQI